MPDIRPTPIFGVEFTRALQDAAADGTAQKRGDVVGIQHIARGHGNVDYDPASAADYSVTATSLTALDTTNLRSTVVVSGKRPVRVQVSMIAAAPSSQSMVMSVLMDGVALAPRLIYTNTTAILTLTGFIVIPAGLVSSGEHTFDLAALVSGGTGTIYCGRSNPIRMEVTEV